MQSRRTASMLWKAAIVCCGGLAVADSLGAFGALYAPYFWGYFTNIATLATVAYFIADIVWLLFRGSQARPGRRKERHGGSVAPDAPYAGGQGRACLAPPLKHALMIAMLLTMLVGHFMLGFRISSDMMVNVDLLIMHYIVPVMSVLDWVLFDAKGTIGPWEPLGWLAFPLAYLIALELLVNVFGVYMGGESPTYGMYPYPFLQADVLGWKTVATTVAAMLAGIAALGYCVYGLDRLFARLEARRKKTGAQQGPTRPPLRR